MAESQHSILFYSILFYSILLKVFQKQKQEWLSLGHGQYEEIADEKAFFETTRKSANVVCHFYRDSTFRCKIVDKHLALLAPRHVETHFVKIDAEKCPFLIERLHVVVLPTVCLVKSGKTVDYIVGFDDLGGADDFPTEVLEWRIARAEVIKYDGDLATPPVTGVKKSLLDERRKNKTIRGKAHDDSSDDDE